MPHVPNDDNPAGTDVAYPCSVNAVALTAAPDGGWSGAAFFDLDKTLMAQSSTLAFARPFYRGGLMGRRAAARNAYAQLIFSLGGANARNTEVLRRELSRLVTGWPVETVQHIVAEAIDTVVDPALHAEAMEVIDEHRSQGRAVVVISASGSDVVEPIAARLGADYVVASQLQTRDGKYTGAISFYAYGPAKAEAMSALAAECGWDLATCHAYSDSSTDLPMLEAVGNPWAVNPDSALRSIAQERGWPVLRWHRTVSLRERFSNINPRTASTVALGVVAVGIAVGMARSRARKRAGGAS